MHFPGFCGNAPTTSRQGTLPFYKNKNRGNLCQNLKNYILTYKSNNFTIMRICSVQRCYKPCRTRHRFPNPIKYPGRFMEWIKKTGNKVLSTLEPMKVYNSYTVCGLHFTSKDFGTNNRLLNVAVPSIQLPSSSSPDLPPLQLPCSSSYSKKY
jgi:hypothetical protein